MISLTIKLTFDFEHVWTTMIRREWDKKICFSKSRLKKSQYVYGTKKMRNNFKSRILEKMKQEKKL